MSTQNYWYFASALIAIAATTAYHFVIKKIPSDIHPLISVMAIYLGVLLLTLIALPFFVKFGDIAVEMKKLNWTQAALACIVLLMEFGFLMMYRSGWDLSLGNVVTGVFINMALMAIGLFWLKEQLNSINIIGLLLCIAGVAMVGYRPAS